MIVAAQNNTESKEALNETPWALEDLPPFPSVATRLLHLLSSKDVQLAEVGRMVAAEPVFATRVLQMANSPLFSLQGQVRTISHAIILLGLDRVSAIAMTRATADFVAPALRIEALRRCWRNSLAGAIVAEKLARACRMDADEAYLAGLLRDIGRLALLVKYPEPYANLLAVTQENVFDLLATERDLFDIDHCQAGAWLTRKMSFPDELCDVVAHHHEPPAGDVFRLASLIRVADRLADAVGFSAIMLPDAPDVEEVLNDLPAPAQSRISHDSEELRGEIAQRIEAWR